MSEPLISDEDIDAEVIDAGDIRLASGRALARRIIALTRARLAERLMHQCAEAWSAASNFRQKAIDEGSKAISPQEHVATIRAGAYEHAARIVSGKGGES